MGYCFANTIKGARLNNRKIVRWTVLQRGGFAAGADVQREAQTEDTDIHSRKRAATSPSRRRGSRIVRGDFFTAVIDDVKQKNVAARTLHRGSSPQKIPLVSVVRMQTRSQHSDFAANLLRIYGGFLIETFFAALFIFAEECYTVGNTEVSVWIHSIRLL